MKFLPRNTLAYYNAAPQGRRHDVSALPVEVFAKACKKYRETCGMTKPEQDAITFYTLNHCVALIKKSFTLHEPLPEWAITILDQYATVCHAQGQRMLHYILSICAREMRHLQEKCHMTPAKWKQLEAAGTSTMVAYLKSVPHNEDAAVERYMNVPPQVTVAQYIKTMSVGFHKMGWGGDGASSTGYGGPKWGLVADAAMEMLMGHTSMEMLVNTGFNLAHNGGPIFNKGMMYQQYNAALITVLDVQQSSQMPELVIEGLAHLDIPVEAKKAVKLLVAAHPDAFTGYVDWQLVETMIPAEKENKASYHIQIQEMKKKHPVAVKPVVKAKPVIKMMHGQKVVVKGTWDVFPGQTVEVVERVA